MAELLGNVGVVAVEFYRVRRAGGSPKKVTATATVNRLTDLEGHGFIDLDVVEESTPDPSTGFGRLLLTATDDPQVAEAFGWSIVLDGAVPLRTIAVPTPAPGAPGSRTVTIGTGSDARTYPAVWLLDLADFSAPSVPPGADLGNYFTRGETDSRVAEFVEAHDDDPQAHPDIRALIGSGASGAASDGAGGVLAGTYPNPGFAVDMATQAELNAHVAAPSPHPSYDDIPSLALLFESRLP